MKNQIEELRKVSGAITYSDPLTSFFYQLIRDELPAGTVEKIVQGVVDEPVEGCLFTNGWLAQYANNLAERLTNAHTENLKAALSNAFFSEDEKHNEHNAMLAEKQLEKVMKQAGDTRLQEDDLKKLEKEVIAACDQNGITPEAVSNFDEAKSLIEDHKAKGWMTEEEAAQAMKELAEVEELQAPRNFAELAIEKKMDEGTLAMEGVSDSAFVPEDLVELEKKVADANAMFVDKSVTLTSEEVENLIKSGDLSELAEKLGVPNPEAFKDCRSMFKQAEEEMKMAKMADQINETESKAVDIDLGTGPLGAIEVVEEINVEGDIEQLEKTVADGEFALQKAKDRAPTDMQDHDFACIASKIGMPEEQIDKKDLEEKDVVWTESAVIEPATAKAIMECQDKLNKLSDKMADLFEERASIELDINNLRHSRQAASPEEDWVKDEELVFIEDPKTNPDVQAFLKEKAAKNAEGETKYYAEIKAKEAAEQEGQLANMVWIEKGKCDPELVKNVKQRFGIEKVNRTDKLIEQILVGSDAIDEAAKELGMKPTNVVENLMDVFRTGADRMHYGCFGRDTPELHVETKKAGYKE